MLRKIILPIINISRKYLRNTWVHRLPFTSWLYRMIFRLGVRSTHEVISFRGHSFQVDTRDTSVVPSMMSGDFEKTELDWFLKVLGRGMTVVDVGANIGVHSVIAAKAIGKKGKVIAFEPVGANVGLYRKNLELNDVVDTVTLQQAAVGASAGTAKMHLHPTNIATHSLTMSSDKYEEVQLVTLDDVLNKTKNVDILKIDIEGYEGYALDGAKKTLQKHKPILFMEYNRSLIDESGYDPHKLLATLHEHYSYAYRIDERTGSVEQIDLNDIVDEINTNLIMLNKALAA